MPCLLQVSCANGDLQILQFYCANGPLLALQLARVSTGDGVAYMDAIASKSPEAWVAWTSRAHEPCDGLCIPEMVASMGGFPKYHDLVLAACKTLGLLRPRRLAGLGLTIASLTARIHAVCVI